MAKKKEKPQVINNIGELNLEIDYDKLAEAIVKAQKQTDEMLKDDTDETETLGFWKAIWYIIRNKEKMEGNILIEAMSGLMTFVFNMLSILFFLSGVVALVFFCIDIYRVFSGNSSALFYGCMYMALGVVSMILVLPMRAIANDIAREKSKSYILAVFSSVMNFSAVVIALVALFRGAR